MASDAETIPLGVISGHFVLWKPSALTAKADMTAANSRAAYALPQQMIEMLTVGAFGNDMAATPSLVGLAAASNASSDNSQARTASSLSLQIVSIGR